jgi:cell division protein FtsB
MSEEDLKLIIEAYQRKSFELFNQNIVLEVQVSTLRKNLEQLTQENEKLQKSKKGAIKPNDEF